MGTYTTNYQLYMPTVGEQGWGELVNGNFTTIDTTMVGLNSRVGTLETETDAVEERVTTLESTIPEEGVINANEVNVKVMRVDYTASLTDSSGVGVVHNTFGFSGDIVISQNTSYKSGTILSLDPETIRNKYLSFGIKGGSFTGATITFTFKLNTTSSGTNTTTIYYNDVVLGTLTTNNNKQEKSFTVELSPNTVHTIRWSCANTKGSIMCTNGNLYLIPVSE